MFDILRKEEPVKPLAKPAEKRENIEKEPLKKEVVIDVLQKENKEEEKETASEKSGLAHSAGSLLRQDYGGQAGQAWEAIIKWSLYLVIGLTPLFFLPWGALPVAANKQFFVSVLTSIALIAWLAKTIASGKLVWKKSILNFAIVILLLFWGISSYFSSSPFRSLGFGFIDSDTLLNLLKSAIIFFLVGATFNNLTPTLPLPRGGRGRGGAQKAVFVFLLPIAVLAIFAGLKFLNVNLLPQSWDFAKATDFNSVGSANGLALFLGAGLVLITGLLGRFGKSGHVESKGLRAGLVVLAIIIAIELLLINFQPVWWAMAGAMLFLAAYGLSQEMQYISRGARDISGASSVMKSEGNGVLRIQKIILPIAILAVSILLLLVRLPISDVLSLPAEVSPSQSATYDIAKEVLKSKGGVANLFGSGPATFTYDYGLYRSIDLNQTVFWGARFGQGASLFLTALATTGVLGVCALLFFVFSFVWQSLKSVKFYGKSENSLNDEGKSLPIILAAAALFLIISWFFYQINFSLLISVFVLLGLLVAASGKSGKTPPQPSPYQGEGEGGVREISLLVSPQRTLIISLILIILMVGAISALYLEGQKYIAGLYYSAGINVYNKTGNFDAAFAKLTKAINLNSSSDQYWRTLSQMFLVKTGSILNDPAWQGGAATALEDLRSQFQLNMSQAVSAAQRAKDENPAESLNWSNTGFVYENILNFVNGGEKFLVDAYKKATELEPSNPALQNDLGRAHLAVADKIQAQINQLASAQQQNKAKIDELVGQRNGEWIKAIEELEKSVSLKGDYSPARFLLVQVYSRQGELKKAIAQSEAYRALNSKDPGSAFQLGFLYYKNNQLDAAKAELERAVSLSSDYSNARYFLGLIYDAQGNKQAAKEQFEKIASLNPENAEVRKILENLNAGKPALETISPPAPTPENRTAAPVPETGGANEQSIK